LKGGHLGRTQKLGQASLGVRRKTVQCSLWSPENKTARRFEAFGATSGGPRVGCELKSAVQPISVKGGKPSSIDLCAEAPCGCLGGERQAARG
jgi:hypothetical protein